MSTHAAATSVRTAIVVEVPIERAFAVFTEDFGAFKPPEHNMLGVAIAETVFEPRVGGYLYDRGVDGSECRWARVLAYEPLTARCSAGTSARTGSSRPHPQKTSEWEASFIAEAPERTRVEIEHRGLDRHGEGWEGVREGVAGDQGWPLYLQRYAERLKEEIR